MANPMGLATPVGGSFVTKDTHIVGAAELSAELLFRGAWAHQKSISIAIMAGKALVESATKHSMDRPGPREVSGDYHKSFYYSVQDNGLTASVYAGSSAPFAMRLEYGFHGTDSLGRVYHQNPLPHWRPASDEVLPMYEEALIEVADLDYVTTGV